jgi:hypothetical protein
MSPTTVMAVLSAGLLFGAVLAGGGAVLVMALVLAVLVMLDAQALLRRRGLSAILPASALLAVGLPVAAFRGSAFGMSALVAAALGVAMLTILSGARRRAVHALGATLLAGLLPGLGAAAVVDLGVREPVTLLLLVFVLLAAEGAAALMRYRAAGVGGSRASAGREAEVAGALAAVVLCVLVGLWVTAVPPQVAVGVGAFGLLGVMGATSLREALIESDGSPVPGLVVSATLSVALAAPAVLLLLGSFGG